MRRFRSTILRVVTALALVIAMVSGAGVFLGNKAQASPPGTYTVTFNPNGGKVYYNGQWRSNNVAITVGGGAYVQNLNAKRTPESDYEFLGWSINRKTVTYPKGQPITAYGNMTLYAMYKDKRLKVSYFLADNYAYFKDSNGYAVTNGNNGAYIHQVFEYGVSRTRTINSPNYTVVPPAGKTLKGWRISFSGEFEAHVFNKNTTIQAACEFYHRPNDTYVTFMAVFE
jgi:Listeria-Bacteroides repeat domain (List_Bact_rpt).